MAFPRCATCTHLSPSKVEPCIDDRPSEFLGRCMRVRAAHEVDRESSDERESFDWFSATDCQKAARAAKIKGLAEAARAMATDAEEFFAALLVDESFGCVLHFPKEAT